MHIKHLSNNTINYYYSLLFLYNIFNNNYKNYGLLFFII